MWLSCSSDLKQLKPSLLCHYFLVSKVKLVIWIILCVKRFRTCRHQALFLLHCAVGSSLSCRTKCKSISQPVLYSAQPAILQMHSSLETAWFYLAVKGCVGKKKKKKALVIKGAIQMHLLEQSRQFLVLYLHRLKRNLCHLEQNNA